MGCPRSLLPFLWLAGSVRSQPAHPTQSIFNHRSLHSMTFESTDRFLDDTESWIYEAGPGRSMLTSRQHSPATLSSLLPDKAMAPNQGFLTLVLFPETTRLSPFLCPGLSKVISFTHLKQALPARYQSSHKDVAWHTFLPVVSSLC